MAMRIRWSVGVGIVIGVSAFPVLEMVGNAASDVKSAVIGFVESNPAKSP
jgi:hypothetical protein